MRNTLSIVAVAVFCLLFQFVPAQAAPVIPPKDTVVTTGVPLWATTMANPMVLKIVQIDPANNTKTITQTVTIPNIPKFVPPAVPLFMRPPPMMGENVFQYQARVQQAYQQYVANNNAAYIAAWNMASQNKAMIIANAINAQIGAGTATAGAKPANAAGYASGTFTITNALSFTYGKNSNTTGEVGDGVRQQPGAGPPPAKSPYSYGASMGSPSGLNPTAAGTDPLGNSSVIEFGISGVYIASWFPSEGDSLDTILSGMQTLLESNATFTGDGYSAAFDPGTGILTMSGGPDGNFDDGSDEVYFSMDDMNLDGELGVTYGITANLVPEPASLALLAAGSAVLLLKRRRSYTPHGQL